MGELVPLESLAIARLHPLRHAEVRGAPGATVRVVAVPSLVPTAMIRARCRADARRSPAECTRDAGGIPRGTCAARHHDPSNAAADAAEDTGEAHGGIV